MAAIGKREHMPCLDGLRGLAALMVLFGHAADFGLPTFIDSQARDCGVLIFFALSGFLMGDLYLSVPPHRQQVWSYAVARFARIVPFFYFIVIGSFLYFYIDRYFVYPITIIQLLRLLTFNGSVSIFWSIAPEVQFYVFFVGLWYLHSWFGQEWRFVLLVGIISLVCLLTIRHWPGVFVFSKFHIFALGVLSSIGRRRLGHAWRFAALFQMAGFLGLLVLNVPSWADTLLGTVKIDWRTDAAAAAFYGNMPRVLIAVLAAFVFSYRSSVGVAIFANPSMRLVGRCSFSIYLLHEIVYDIFTRYVVMSNLPPWLSTFVIAGVSVGISVITFWYIERPFQQWTRRLLVPRRKPQEIAVAI